MFDRSLSFDEQSRVESSQPKVDYCVRVVLPAFNESESLPPLLERIRAAFAESPWPYEVIVVDDGSRDDTAKVARGFSDDLPLSVVEHQVNQGLGAALKTGLKEAISRSGPEDVVVTMDCDNTHAPALIARMIPMIREGFDVVIASRFQSGGRVIGVPLHRQWLSIGARCAFTVAFPTKGVRDYTCGYRAYRSELLRRAFDRYGEELVSETGFACMIEVLLKLRRMKAVFGEVPLLLRYDFKPGESKMRVFRTIYRSLRLIGRQWLSN